jgi:hypothetical protein
MTSQAPRPPLSVWMRLIIGLYTAALLSYIGMGAFSRMMADDFCTAYTANALGNPFAAARQWYDTWSGLYTNFFIKSLIAPFEPFIHLFLTGLFILGIFAILWLVLRDVLRWYTLPHAGWIAFLLSGLLTFGLVDGAVSRQPIFWAGALIPYSLALLPLIGALGLAFRLIFVPLSRSTQILMTIVFAVLVFLIAGFSEVYAVYEGALWGLLLIIGTFALPKEHRTRLWTVMLVGVVMTAIGLVIILAAPGNEIRRAAQEQTRLITSLIDLTLKTFDFSLSIFILEPYGIVHFFLAFFGTLGVWLWTIPKDGVSLPAPQRLGRAFFISFLAAFALVMVAVAAPMYGAGIVTSRTLMPVRFTQILLFGLWGYWAAAGLTRTHAVKRLQTRRAYRLVKWEILAAFVIIPAIVLVRHISLIGDFSTYARQWDARHAQILEARERGETQVTIAQLDYNLEEYLTLDGLAKASTPADAKWVYDCATSYYGVELQLSEPTEIVSPDKAD